MFFLNAKHRELQHPAKKTSSTEKPKNKSDALKSETVLFMA